MQVLANAEKLGAGVHFNTAIPWGSQVELAVVLCEQDAGYKNLAAQHVYL